MLSELETIQELQEFLGANVNNIYESMKITPYSLYYASLYKYNLTCKVTRRLTRGILSLNTKRGAEELICPGQRAGQSHQRRYNSSSGSTIQ